MRLNIANEETYKLAVELARLTHESITQAVTEAVRQRLNQVRSESEGKLSERLLEIGRDCASHLREPFNSADHGTLLYDESGLPR